MKQKIYLILWMSLFNVYDLISTYIMSPDLALEGNWVVRKLNGGWPLLITDCVVWQLIYTMPVIYSQQYKNKPATKTRQKMILSFCRAVFPGYLLMKFLVGTDNLISSYCATYLHNYALLNKRIGHQFRWTVDLTAPHWMSLKGRLIYAYAFTLPTTKMTIINISTVLLVFIKSIHFYFLSNTNDQPTKPDPI